MNIRVLIYMNPLVVDKISKKFLWEKDSGFLYTKQLIQSLPTDWRFTILTPKKFDRVFFDNEHEIECIEYDYSTSIHQNRYHFNRNILAKALPYGVDIDVVLNMQPEVTANLRVFFENQRREKPIIVNYFHWIDSIKNEKFGTDLGGFIIREVEGIDSGDISLFHNEYARSLLEETRTEYRLPYNEYDCGYFHPLPTNYGEKPIELPDKKIILFNHRLNNTTGWKEVLKIFKKLDRSDSVLWFTDEQNMKENKELEQIPNVIVKSIPFESYGYLLKKSHFTICNLQDYATWNMAVLDSMNYGTQVISNDLSLMKELGCNYQNDLEYGIKKYLELDKIHRENKYIEDFKLQEYIESEITKRAEGKDPKKLDQVKGLINSKETEKREFVNTFWSFHANSNFQIIRWCLLISGYNDDISKKLSIYKLNNDII